MNDLISIIVPVYNIEQYLRRCIESILCQTYSNIEVILINDGSTDKSGNICNEYSKKDKRIKVLHKENGGVSDARNTGLEIAVGQYIGFVDGDDYVESDFFQILYDIAVKYDTEVSMVSYNHVKDNRLTPWTDTLEFYILEKEEAIIQLLFDKKIQNYIWNIQYKAEIFNEIRFPVGMSFEDISIMYEIFKKMNKVACLEIPKYNYVFREDSIINHDSHKKLEDELFLIISRFENLSIDFPDLQKYNSYGLILWMIRIYTFMVKSNDFNDTFFREHYTLFMDTFEQHKEFIIDNLNPMKRIILFMILWDINKSRAVLKMLYNINDE